MTILNRLASALGRNDEVPNQALAKEIAATNDASAVEALVAALAHPDKDIQSDAIKVLYEIGAVKPELIANYVNEFIALLNSSNNRLVWGGMTALGAIADRRTYEICSQVDVILQATEGGSAITQDWGIRVLAAVVAHAPECAERVLPFLVDFLEHCAGKDLPRHAESCLVAITRENRREFVSVLEDRVSSLKGAQIKRVEKVIAKLNAL
jgi:HEAT repeat protein